MSKTFQELTIKDPFMFAAAMSDEEQCKAFLSIVLDADILDVSVVTEKTLTYHPKYHGVRLDVLAIEKGTKRRFNVEMQVKNNKNLPKRCRYYHAQLDMDALLTGINYNELPDTYVIFICDYDPLETGLYRYTIIDRCEENGEVIPNGSHTIWLSSKGTNDSDEPKELVDFLKYVNNPDASDDSDTTENDSFLKLLKENIAAIKRNRDWEAKYMLFKEIMDDEREAGRREGLEVGRREGEASGRCEGIASSILAILSLSGTVSPSLRETISSQKDETTLTKWLTIAASAKSPSEFEKKING